MTRWEELSQLIVKTAKERKKTDWANELIVEVKRAAAKNLCERWEQGRVKKVGRTIQLASKAGSTMQVRKAEIGAILLRGFAGAR